MMKAFFMKGIGSADFMEKAVDFIREDAVEPLIRL
jgi:hypothetical protein